MTNTNAAVKNRKGWSWEEWLVAAGLYHTLESTVKDTERYQRLTKAWVDCQNPYQYREP